MLGGPHSLLQVYAWSNMLVSYSQESSLSQAVVDTFSGEKPCKLCKHISASKSSSDEQKNENAPWSPKSSKFFPDLIAPSVVFLKNPFGKEVSEKGFFVEEGCALLHRFGPPVPPPRC